MMHDKFTRREFIHETATTAAVVAASAAMPGTAFGAGASDFASQWKGAPDRVWLGAEYWANPLQDWRIANGRIECVNAAANRSVQLLTRQIGEKAGEFEMSVRIGRVGGNKLDGGKGSAGFRIGIMGPLREYRNSLIFGQGIDAGITSEGKLFVGNPASGVPIQLSVESIELVLRVTPQGEASTIVLTAHNMAGKELARVSRENVAPATLVGNLALVANFGGGGANAGQKGKKAKSKAADGATDAGAGQFWFADWKVSGSRVEAHDDQAFGPILFNHYTLSSRVMKMTAQMPPLGAQDSQSVRLEVQRGGSWKSLGDAPIHAAARTATFRIEKWDASRDVPYRLVYSLKQGSGSNDHIWTGTIRRDPVDQPVLTVADVSCNIHEAFPNSRYTANMARLNPDFIAFVGDQFYESTGGLWRAANAAGAIDSGLLAKVVYARVDVARADARPAEHFDSR